MKPHSKIFRSLAVALALGCSLSLLAQPAGPPVADDGPPGDGGFPPDGGPGFGGPPPFGGPGGMMRETKLVKQFDKDGNGWLNAEERKAAREFMAKEGAGRNRRGPWGGPRGFRGPGESHTTPEPGRKLSPADVPSFPEAPLYASNVLRTFFLEFEDADWEKELSEFKNTDVEVPAKLTVDGKTYLQVGVHFHGMSSFMMVGEGSKRSLVLTLDFIDHEQTLGGYRKVNLLNSHEDPSFLRSVLSLQIAREYLPAPKANFARVVINGESWGVYVNQEHFSKDFTKEWFGTGKGARWKVPGSPNGHGGLKYLGDDVSAYKSIYQLKSKEEDRPWNDLIHLCRVLEETAPEKLERTLAPILDIDGVLKFFAWENVLANGDGFWTRASDFDLYEDVKGVFHVVPYDANETFSFGGGPGGPGGRGGFGPGMFLAPEILSQADKNGDQKLSRDEFSALADAWIAKLDPEKSGKVDREQFNERIAELLPMPDGRGGPGPAGAGGPGGGPGGRRGPGRPIGPVLFSALDANHDDSLTSSELKGTFAKWFVQWDTAKAGTIDEEALRAGLTSVLPRPQFAGPGGGRRGGGGPGGPSPGQGGVKLDPLVTANDSSKPLLSKLLAVPALRARYLGYVHEIAERWLDWQRLGPIANQYHALIADEVKLDTRKLDSFEEFETSLADEPAKKDATRGPGGGSLKAFADQRRAYLQNHTTMKTAGK